MLNLEDFSKTVQLHFNHSYIAPFQSWEATFNDISNNLTDRILIIIDEFPYIIQENQSIKSLLQHCIDHDWKNKNIFLILCGSSVSIMENEIMGSKPRLNCYS